MSSNNSKEFNMQPSIFSYEYERQDSISNIQTEDLRIASTIQRIRTLLEQQSVIIPDHCDQFIMRCLRVKDYDEEKTVNLLKNFGIMMRMEEMQDVFEQFRPSLYKDFYYSGIMTPLSKRDLKGRLVLLGRIGLFIYSCLLITYMLMFHNCIHSQRIKFFSKLETR
ncbi:unnamed protein product [Orchesella dallaii]|uniref:Uncharacterized protein n=1 Tax=Orchesella dallaii TaxID=48710 RepID=A0ABP1S236_9HEXA